MAGLCWIAVTLALFLSTENTLAVVDVKKLATIVYRIKGQYGGPGMFSLAVRMSNINQNLNTILQEVFRSDPGNNVKNTINNNEVYTGNRVVAANEVYTGNRVVEAAKLLKKPGGGAEHAESRVVDNLGNLINNRNNNDFLLFYVYASPCDEKCSSDTHPESILQRIKTIHQWANYAVVFSKLFRPSSGEVITEQQRRGALEHLGTSVGLNNIYRCDIQTQGRMQCTNCSNGGAVADYCVSDSSQTSSSSNQPSFSG
ncbi:hypothetical protein L3Q82_020083 [Scortum barcoo]|uniref:Uncharacterized protein n=1 Tax=Scortum barcoo TaxID=214431 RepID=A0ACB8VEA5_9TELE|nr:hypothetical protein L3Q82_020083 [Scortum barcoo]